MFQLRGHFADAPTGIDAWMTDFQSTTPTTTPTTSPIFVKLSETWSSPFYTLLRTAAMATSAYHGYKRNNSVGWAIGWALLGGLFPVITPVIALAQGFGKPKKGS